MKYARLWERLLEFLNEWSTAVEDGHGRIEVALQDKDGSTRAVEVLEVPKLPAGRPSASHGTERSTRSTSTMAGLVGRHLRAHQGPRYVAKMLRPAASCPLIVGVNCPPMLMPPSRFPVEGV
jgi:hypothetical protein